MSVKTVYKGVYKEINLEGKKHFRILQDGTREEIEDFSFYASQEDALEAYNRLEPLADVQGETTRWIYNYGKERTPDMPALEDMHLIVSEKGDDVWMIIPDAPNVSERNTIDATSPKLKGEFIPSGRPIDPRPPLSTGWWENPTDNEFKTRNEPRLVTSYNVDSKRVMGYRGIYGLYHHTKIPLGADNIRLLYNDLDLLELRTGPLLDDEQPNNL